MVLNVFPTVLMLLAMVIPITYSLRQNKKNLKAILMILACCVVCVLLYPLVFFLTNKFSAAGYLIGKLIVFVIVPFGSVAYIERWSAVDIFKNMGVRKKNLSNSIIYGMGALVITVAIWLAITWRQKGWFSASSVIMGAEAFNEEFFFRGFLFLYLWHKTEIKTAYATAVVGFVLAHGQYLMVPVFFVPAFVQGILLVVVVHKTENIIGPWASHGLNRVLPPLLRLLI